MTRPSIYVQRIEQSIHVLRGQKVLLDAEPAALDGVETCVLVHAVKRNVRVYRAAERCSLTSITLLAQL